MSQALRALGIRLIQARSPQARGRSERAFGNHPKEKIRALHPSRRHSTSGHLFLTVYDADMFNCSRQGHRLCGERYKAATADLHKSVLCPTLRERIVG